MRFLITMTPRAAPPPDMIVGMIEQAQAWHERHADRFESFGVFPGGGGFGVIEVQDEAELHRIVGENPFAFLSEVTTRAAVRPEVGFEQAKAIFSARMAHA